MPISSCNRRISNECQHDSMSLRGHGTCGILKQTLPETKLTAIKAIDNWIRTLFEYVNSQQIADMMAK